MSEPLEDAVKQEIEKWKASGAKYSDWIEENLNRLNEIYCGKETVLSDRDTVITQSIQKISLKNMFLLFEGEKYKKWIHAFECSFDEKYAMTVEEFHITQTPNKLRIGFKAYE